MSMDYKLLKGPIEQEHIYFAIIRSREDELVTILDDSSVGLTDWEIEGVCNYLIDDWHRCAKNGEAHAAMIETIFEIINKVKIKDKTIAARSRKLFKRLNDNLNDNS